MSETKPFVEFGKIPRLYRDCVITEKLDGTNVCIDIEAHPHITYLPNGEHDRTALHEAFVGEGCFIIRAGSRSRWISVEDDHFGFAAWVHENSSDLLSLGVGTHHGEWWGYGIQRGYDLGEKRFSLFNTSRWGGNNPRPTCCHVVPELYSGPFDTDRVVDVATLLKFSGSHAAPGFGRPEGVVVYHKAANALFKYTFDKNDGRKGI